jgi:hypothetical protein
MTFKRTAIVRSKFSTLQMTASRSLPVRDNSPFCEHGSNNDHVYFFIW